MARALSRRSFVALGAALGWTAIVALSLDFNLRKERRFVNELARQDLLTRFSRDVLYRRWASMHGGVYVPVTAITPPNPYLSAVPERDLTTPSGRALTLMNPAYMTRQVFSMGGGHDGTMGHITSLRPLRPANAPDDWESNALMAFERGEREVIALVESWSPWVDPPTAAAGTNNALSRMAPEHGRYLRLMKPLVAEKGCLKCHGAQGYREGEIRGGLSVSIPMAPYDRALAGQLRDRWAFHVILWAAVLLLIGALWGYLRRKDHEKQRQELAQRSRERLFAVGTLASGVAHEFNNILAIIRLQAQRVLAAKSMDAARLETVLGGIIEQTQRGAGIVDGITTVAQAQSHPGVPVRVDQLLDEVLEAQAGAFEAERIKLVRAYHGTRAVPADPEQLARVFRNILSNARHAMRGKGGGTLTLSTADLPDGVEVRIADTGVGIPPSAMEHLFVPFFTTKGAFAHDKLGLPGTGLGLAVCARILQEHGGSIRAESEEGKGAVFILELPLEKK